MKRFTNAIKAVLSAGCVFLAVSCGDYLDTEPSGSSITLRQLQLANDIDSASSPGKLMAGIYPLTYEALSGNDLGQKGCDIFSDLLSSDLVLAGSIYGWYIDIADLVAPTKNNFIENYIPWRYYYKIIFAANNVIESLNGREGYYMGQAKALRAYAYFYLSQFYIQEYDPSRSVLPLYTNTSQANLGPSRLDSIYMFMITDLRDAIRMLEGFKRTNKTEINKYVAEGLLAYVYASMGSYGEAKTLAKDIIDNGGFTPLDSAGLLGGFNDVNTPSWMWGVDLTIDIGLRLRSWWGQMDIYTYSYASGGGEPKEIDSGLYAAIKNEDVRKKQFRLPTDKDYPLAFSNKFYHPERIIAGQSVITTDYIYMRVEEFQLLHIESAAKTGDEATAKSELKSFLSARFANDTSYAYVDALSGKALLDEIYLQTRIEFFAEGKTYLAMKRFKATTKRGPNHLSLVGVSIPYNDDRLTLSIPRNELDNNPNLKKNK